MAVPEAITQALDERHSSSLPGEAADGIDCEGVLRHSPNPLRLYRVDLGNGRLVLLCGTCRDNVAVLLELRRRGVDNIPWRRGFGNQLRSLVDEENHA